LLLAVDTEEAIEAGFVNCILFCCAPHFSHDCAPQKHRAQRLSALYNICVAGW